MKRLRRQVCLIFFLGSILLTAQRALFGAAADDLFQKANEAYRNHEFEAALDGYRSALGDLKNAEVYYNIGNAAFKTSKLGLAILNYERAKRLDPRNEDVNSNLKYARTLVEYRVEDKRSWYYQKLTELLCFVRLNECFLLLLFLYFLLAFQWFLALVRRKRIVFGRFGKIFLSMWILVALLTWVKFYETKVHQKAVVVGDKIDVRYGPSKSDKMVFSLVEGIEFSVEDKLDDWYRISLVNGGSGWANKDGIEIV